MCVYVLAFSRLGINNSQCFDWFESSSARPAAAGINEQVGELATKVALFDTRLREMTAMLTAVGVLTLSLSLFLMDSWR